MEVPGPSWKHGLRQSLWLPESHSDASFLFPTAYRSFSMGFRKDGIESEDQRGLRRGLQKAGRSGLPPVSCCSLVLVLPDFSGNQQQRVGRLECRSCPPRTSA